MLNILEIIRVEKEEDWHIIYACLEVISYNINLNVNINNIIDVFDELSTHGMKKFFHKQNSWRIREKIAEICLCNSDVIDTKTKDKFLKIILKMKAKESHAEVLKTLNNPEYI